MRNVTQFPSKFVRKLDKSQAETVFLVRLYFGKERDENSSLEIAQFFKRTSNATGVNQFNLMKIRTGADLENSTYNPDETLHIEREREVAEQFDDLTRKLIRYIFLDKNAYQPLSQTTNKFDDLRKQFCNSEPI